MAELSLQKLRNLIPNDRCIRRRDVATAIKRLWITQDDREALGIAADLIKLAIEDGVIVQRENILNGVNPAKRTYQFCAPKSASKELEKMLELLISTQKKLAEAERKLGFITCC